MSQSTPIVFFLGPSGVGKTTLGDAVQKHLGLLHILFDDHGGASVDSAKLRSEWDTLLDKRDPQPLADELRKRLASSGHTGVAISCPSGVMSAEDGEAVQWHFSRSLLTKMKNCGIRCVTLFGRLDRCRDAAKARIDGRTVTEESWNKSNSNWYGFQPEAFSDQILDPFCGAGERRAEDSLVEEFRRRFLV